jgi:hypothetical protein
VIAISWRAFLNHLAGNVGVVVVVAIALLIVVMLWTPAPDPSFTCGKGKHWDTRYVGDVATLGCFE